MSHVAPDEAGIVLFLDYNFGGKIVSRALTEAGIAHEIHLTHFEIGALDVEWLPEVGRRGWIVITKDKRISRNTLEVEALRNAGVGAFIFSSDNLTDDLAGNRWRVSYGVSENQQSSSKSSFWRTKSRSSANFMTKRRSRCGVERFLRGRLKLKSGAALSSHAAFVLNLNLFRFGHRSFIMRRLPKRHFRRFHHGF